MKYFNNNSGKCQARCRLFLKETLGLSPQNFLMAIGSEEAMKPPSAHRTVRTGPYTAPHVILIHWWHVNQCGCFSADLIFWPISWINHLFGYALWLASVIDIAHLRLLEKAVLPASPRGTLRFTNLLNRLRLFFCWSIKRDLILRLKWASIFCNWDGYWVML